jgi:hypothetical protein
MLTALQCPPIHIFHEDMQKLPVAADADQALDVKAPAEAKPVRLVLEGEHGIGDRRP